MCRRATRAMSSVATKQRAKAHAKHPSYCSCGRVVHGNGGRAMHFYIEGQRGRPRPGHVRLTQESWTTMHQDPNLWGLQWLDQMVERLERALANEHPDGAIFSREQVQARLAVLQANWEART